MRAVERAAGGGVAGAAGAQDLAVAILHRGGGLVDQRVFHPAVEHDACAKETRERVAAFAQHRGQPRHGLAAHRRDGDGKLGGLAFDRVAANGRRNCAPPSSRLRERKRAVERRHPAGMLGVDRQHQPVEKPPPLGRLRREQPVHRRRQPDHAQMIAEGGGGTDRLAVDPAAPAGRRAFAAGRVDAGAERGEAERAFDLGGHRPGAVALDIGDVVERGAAQAAAGRQKRDRLDAVGLAGAVRPDQHHHVAARSAGSPLR